jgi:hypothetical protein
LSCSICIFFKDAIDAAHAAWESRCKAFLEAIADPAATTLGSPGAGPRRTKRFAAESRAKVEP